MRPVQHKVRNPYVGNEGYHCFACDPNHATGLRLEFFVEGERVVSSWTPRAELEGYPGVIHGGIQATLADEIAGWYLHAIDGVAGVTTSISVEYHAPATTESGPFRIEAEKVSAVGRNVEIAVTISDREDRLLATARCRYAVFSDAVARKRLHFPGREAFLDDAPGS